LIVTNRNRTTAIVIRHERNVVTLVPMKSGKLSACNIAHETFVQDWRETAYSLANALERFLRHARREGASQEVLKGLKKLQQRDRWVVANLF
jgi:hypothetical protein